MNLKEIKTEDAAGHVLCHDITQIVRGVSKGARFRKGHVITAEDIPVLLSLGKDHVYIWEGGAGTLHENEAAEILCGLCLGENMRRTPPREGKIELIADAGGLLLADKGRLRAVNGLGEMAVATLPSGFTVKKGDKVCGVRVIPLVIEKSRMEQAKLAAGSAPLLRIKPLKPKKYGLITTGNEVWFGRVKDDFTPAVKEKMDEYGCEMLAHAVLGDAHEKITGAIVEMLAAGAEMVLCAGGMSVDPDDRTPLAIKNSGVRVVSYGAPVLPGSMFMIGYTGDGRPVCGLPGCVMYGGRTVFDLALPFLLADEPVTAEWLAGLGNGGLCRGCEECRFPNCSFGKGA